MTASDPQFLYMILVLPSFFGLTLIGEGLNRVLNEELRGWFSVFFGFVFIGSVVFAYFFMASQL